MGLHFVEVMACPSGCCNGGGQIRVEKLGDREQRLKNVVKLYSQLGASLEADDKLRDLEKEWEQIDPMWQHNSGHTEIHSLKPEENLIHTAQNW